MRTVRLYRKGGGACKHVSIHDITDILVNEHKQHGKAALQFEHID